MHPHGYRTQRAASACQIDPQHQTGRTAVIIRAVFDDFPALDGLPNVCQQDTALIKPGL